MPKILVILGCHEKWRATVNICDGRAFEKRQLELPLIEIL